MLQEISLRSKLTRNSIRFFSPRAVPHLQAQQLEKNKNSSGPIQSPLIKNKERAPSQKFDRKLEEKPKPQFRRTYTSKSIPIKQLTRTSLEAVA